MTIYDIDRAIEDLFEQVDEETGEVLFNHEELEQLQMEREYKIENVALSIRNDKADIEVLEAEIEKIKKKIETVNKKIESKKNFLAEVLNGEKFKTARTSLYFKESNPVEIEDGTSFMAWAKENAPELLTFRPEPSKTKIGEWLDSGKEVPGAKRERKLNPVIR